MLKGTITMAHGSGGVESAVLMREIFGKRFANETLDKLEDAAVLAPPGGLRSPGGADAVACEDGREAPARGGRVVVSTDSFVVTPLVFAGGDIGKLAVCGTVNDVLMMGAIPAYLTCGFILEEGLELDTLDLIAESMARESAAAGVTIVAGDTKVIERRAGAESASGLFINTTGIGYLREGVALGRVALPGATSACAGDAVIVSGGLGDHHACILSARLGVENGIASDCASLGDVVDALYESGSRVHVMRDVTRGGLATVLSEIAASSGALIELDEGSIPVSDEVRAFCGVMGLDPLYMGNEGKMAAIVSGEDADSALAAIRATEHGKDARVIGRVASGDAPGLVIKTRVGGSRRVSALQGEGLPRIC
jgi:hydrogenase expression/formation protein HypE